MPEQVIRMPKKLILRITQETSQKLVRQRGEAHHLVLDDSINIPLSISIIWRSKHNWYCHGLENRSRESVCRFESCLLRHMRNQLSWLEHLSYKQGVSGSNPLFRTKYAAIAQLVEHLIAIQEVVGSRPVSCSNIYNMFLKIK